MSERLTLPRSVVTQAHFDKRGFERLATKVALPDASSLDRTKVQ
jgi:hypothetical protein